MKATSLLVSRHRRVRQLLDAVEQERYVRRALLEDLADDLVATLELEEDVFYPAVRGALRGERARARGAAGEKARAALRACLDAAEDEVAFGPALVALRDAIAPAFEADERELFPRVERAVDAVDLERLGERMSLAYRTLVEAVGDARVARREPAGRRGFVHADAR